METNDETLNAFELDRAELMVTQQLLKIALNHIVQNAADPRAMRESIAQIADELCEGFEIRGFPAPKADAAKEFMRHHAAILVSELKLPT